MNAIIPLIPLSSFKSGLISCFNKSPTVSAAVLEAASATALLFGLSIYLALNESLSLVFNDVCAKSEVWYNWTLPSSFTLNPIVDPNDPFTQP